MMISLTADLFSEERFSANMGQDVETDTEKHIHL